MIVVLARSYRCLIWLLFPHWSWDYLIAAFFAQLVLFIWHI